MKKRFKIPIVKCSKCKSDQYIVVDFSGIKFKKLYIICSECNEKLNLLEKSSDKLKAQKKKLDHLIKRLTNLIIEAKVYVPKNKNELLEVVKNPKHPFTAAVITALVILFMETSGFGIFVALTWILGNLILDPIGWVLIPIIVAIVMTYKDLFKKDKIKLFGENLKNLEEKFYKGEINREYFEKKRNEYFNNFFK